MSRHATIKYVRVVTCVQNATLAGQAWVTDERNSLLPKSFWCISLLLLAAKMPHTFYHCMYYLTLQIKATFVYRIYVAFYQCGVWASSGKNQFCQGEVPCEFCGHAYRSVTVTTNKRQWWAVNIHVELSILIFSDQACCKKKGAEGNVKYTTSNYQCLSSPEPTGTDASAHYLLNLTSCCWGSTVPCSPPVEGNAQHLDRHPSRELNSV